MNKLGFSLIEFLIYLFLSTLLGIVIFSFFHNTQMSFSAIKESAALVSSLQSGYDRIAHDIMMADCQPGKWHCASNEFVCQTIDGCVGWLHTKNRLYRIVGTYDFVQKKWKQKKKTVVMGHVQEFSVSVPLNDRIQSAHVILALTTTQSSIKKQTAIPLLSRVLS